MYNKTERDAAILSPSKEPVARSAERSRVGAPQWFGKKIATPVSLILPMFNESDVVDATLARVVENCELDFVDFEIVVADDASTDDCAQKVARWTARDARIKLVRLPHNQRFGGALRAGLAFCTKEFLIYTDFDLPVALESLPRLLEEFHDADVLTGYSDQGPKYANWRSKVISKGYNFLVRSLFGLHLRDINFGFKALRRTVWDKLDLHSRSPFVDAELFVQAQRRDCRIKEVPVPFHQRELGTSNIRRLDVIAATFADMARLRLAMWAGRR
jgi:glycosyltransferase involved in cell wall biosynthesis